MADLQNTVTKEHLDNLVAKSSVEYAVFGKKLTVAVITFDFGSAVYLLKIGKKVARKGWNGAGMYVYYVPAASYPAQRNSKSTMAGEFPDDMVPYREYLALKTAQGDVATWAPSVSDALATDWCLA